MSRRPTRRTLISVSSSVILQTQTQISAQSTHYYYYANLTTSSRTIWVSWYQKGKTSLDLNEARDYGVLRCTGISWTICKQSAPRSRRITTSTLHHPSFYMPDALPDAHTTVSKN